MNLKLTLSWVSFSVVAASRPLPWWFYQILDYHLNAKQFWFRSYYISMHFSDIINTEKGGAIPVFHVIHLIRQKMIEMFPYRSFQWLLNLCVFLTGMAVMLLLRAETLQDLNMLKVDWKLPFLEENVSSHKWMSERYEPHNIYPCIWCIIQNISLDLTGCGLDCCVSTIQVTAYKRNRLMYMHLNIL